MTRFITVRKLEAFDIMKQYIEGFVIGMLVAIAIILVVIIIVEVTNNDL